MFADCERPQDSKHEKTVIQRRCVPLLVLSKCIFLALVDMRGRGKGKKSELADKPQQSVPSSSKDGHPVSLL